MITARFLRTVAILAAMSITTNSAGATSTASRRQAEASRQRVATPSMNRGTASLDVILHCGYHLGGSWFFCQTRADGGSGTYTYDWWGAEPFLPNSADANVPDCEYYDYAYVTVEVTDSNGNTGSASGLYEC